MYPRVSVIDAPGYEDFEAELIMRVTSIDGLKEEYGRTVTTRPDQGGS